MPGVMVPPPVHPAQGGSWVTTALLTMMTALLVMVAVAYTCWFAVWREARRRGRRFAEAVARLDFNEAEVYARLFLHHGRLR